MKLSYRKNEHQVVSPNADGFAHLSRKWPCHDRMTMSGFCHFRIRKDNKGRMYVCLYVMGMWRWMGSYFHDWFDYNGVAFSIEFQ